MDDFKSDTKDVDHSNPIKQTISLEIGEMKQLSGVTDPAALEQEPCEYTPEEGRQVLRKIDMFILPMLVSRTCLLRPSNRHAYDDMSSRCGST